MVYIGSMAKESRLTILIDPKLRASFKAVCAGEQISMSEKLMVFIKECTK